MGDGVLAYFGYPRAQEDDGEQAVRAALALVDAVANLRTSVDAALQVRIGIATGTVVVCELVIAELPTEQAVVGETPNLAARLQTLAEPGTVLICPSTRRLTGGHFTYRDLGLVALKGWPEPIPVWQVLATSGVESRFKAKHKTKFDSAVRAGGGDRGAVAPLAARHAKGRPSGGAYRGARATAALLFAKWQEV